MFRVAHDFSFQMNHNGELVEFLGQLIFQGEELNEVGSLHTEEDMTGFGVALNQTIQLPEYWTLEMLTKNLFDNVKPIFNNLTAINLTMKNAQYRVAEYSIRQPSYIDIDGVVELPELVG
jgi:hypothetical protein